MDVPLGRAVLKSLELGLRKVKVNSPTKKELDNPELATE